MVCVDDKKKCYRLYDAGFFGNKALSWNSYQELLQSSWKGDVSIRGKEFRGLMQNIMFLYAD